VNQDGKVLDGNHRADVDKDWEVKVILTENRFKELLVRAHAHHRRRVPQEETRALVEEMAEALEKEGIPRTEIALKLVEALPYSENYTRSLIPDIYKNPVKVQAGQIGGEKSATISEQKAATISLRNKTVTIQDTVQCDRCHVSTSSPVEWHNHKLCESCHSKAETDPDGFNGYFAAVSKKPEPHTVLTTDSPRALDTWEVRKAQMSVQHSKEEENIIRGLRAKGYNVETDLDICLMKTTPDFNICLLNGKWVRGYIDGVQVHSGKQSDRDDELRGLLRKRHPEDIVVEVRVKGDSDKETEAKLAEIEEAMKF
jgi:hypothetical protein